MTYEELMRRRMMFQIHSKRNELPKVDTNVPNPNVVKHSATNDYLEFRKKVAAGAKKQRQANTAMFNITQANEQYYEELASNSIMVHAGTNSMTNAYVAKLDDFYGKGKPRYFYTKEEWEGYQRNKQAASQAGADRGTKQKEEASKIENKSYSTKKMEADINNRVSALNAQKAFANASGGVDPVKAAQNSFTNSENKYKAIEKSKELANDSSRWDKYNNKSGKDAIANVISKDSRFTNIKNPDEAAGYPGGPEKYYNDLEDAIKKELDYQKNASSQAGADRGAKEELNSKESNYRKNATNNSGADRATKEKENAEKEYINNATNPNDPKLNKLADSFTENGWKAKSKKMNLIVDRQNKNGMSVNVETAKKKSAKHSSLEDGITTAELTPEQEYLEFRKKVEAGLKHFGQTRGLMSLPVNQALKNGESLKHAGYGSNSVTNKYYAKIDDFWGKGKPRYFYSKEEWDGYQKNKQGASQAGADRGANQKAQAEAGREAAMKNSQPLVQKPDLVKEAQSGREAAMRNSQPLVKNNSSSTNPVKKFGDKLVNAINQSGNSDKSSVTVIIEDTTPENVKASQSGREAAEKSATKRTMTTMAYNKAMKDYNEVAKDIDKKYGFDKLDPEDTKAVNKTWQKLIKDASKVVESGKIDNPNNIKYEYQLLDDAQNSYAWAAYIQEYANEAVRLNSIYNDLQNEYAKTLQTAQAMTDFNALKEANEHAGELFNEMQKVREQINENAKESDSKVIPYLTEVYKELL